MQAFCNRNGVAMNSVRFLFDGNRVNPTQTPQDLDMEDGDVIDVMVEQQPGDLEEGGEEEDDDDEGDEEDEEGQE